MKTVEEIDEALASRRLTEAHIISFQALTRQALEWARQIIVDYPVRARLRIKDRIGELEELQGKFEVMGAFTKPARSNQIEALKWVVDEGDLEALEPLY